MFAQIAEFDPCSLGSMSGADKVRRRTRIDHAEHAFNPSSIDL
jgi:hypothetical protein